MGRGLLFLVAVFLTLLLLLVFAKTRPAQAGIPTGVDFTAPASDMKV